MLAEMPASNPQAGSGCQVVEAGILKDSGPALDCFEYVAI